MLSTRKRTKQGTPRQVRKDTQIGTIEKKYGVDLGVRSDKTLGNFLSEKGYPSLSSMLRDSR